jgi:hypothetical protein
VIVGDAAASPRYQYINLAVHRGGEKREDFDIISKENVRGEACAGPGKERERCICIIAPSNGGLATISSLDSFEMPVSKQRARREGE